MIGIIEGFYGPLWTWDQRLTLSTALADAGMDTYVYAPKDDPFHRERWRDPYPPEEFSALTEFVERSALDVGVAISPGLSMDPDDASDRADLLGKIEQLTATGSTSVGLCFDDIAPGPGLGAAHARVANWVRDRLDASVGLYLVPLHYTGTHPAAYLTELLEVDRTIPIAWTGHGIVNRTITVDDAEAWTELMDGRRPLLWDNTPVNDALMADWMFSGPLRGRDADLPQHLAGYLANPLVQHSPNLPPLLSAAAWARGDDPVAAWESALGADHVFYEGCDGELPRTLAIRAIAGERGALEELTAWFAAASTFTSSELGDDVRPWIDQLRAEAAVGLDACKLLAISPTQSALVAPLLLMSWQPLRRAQVQVLGGRGGTVSAITQDADSQWFALSDSLVHPASVVDLLVDAVMARLPRTP